MNNSDDELDKLRRELSRYRFHYEQQKREQEAANRRADEIEKADKELGLWLVFSLGAAPMLGAISMENFDNTYAAFIWMICCVLGLYIFVLRRRIRYAKNMFVRKGLDPTLVDKVWL